MFIHDLNFVVMEAAEAAETDLRGFFGQPITGPT